jgi:hypothetical protein
MIKIVIAIGGIGDTDNLQQQFVGRSNGILDNSRVPLMTSDTNANPIMMGLDLMKGGTEEP